MGGLIFIFSGIFDVSADAPHWPVTRKIMEIVRDRSVEVRARAVSVPNLSDDQAILKGAGQYAAMCANCHLAPGQERSEIRPGLYPRPPDLSKHAVDPKTAFWVTKHGIKMSGMPAWGRSHDDATLWSIVAFMQKLLGMSPEQYKEMVVGQGAQR
jgi:mono/diheme cytochrome c family protein